MIDTRPAEIEDAEAIAALMQQLGYLSTRELVEHKPSLLSRSKHDAVFVAEAAGVVAGVISVHTLELFHCSGQLGRITSLAVAVEHRRTGVGGSLVRAADEFFVRCGCLRSEVTSGDHRPQAHEFYQSQGYLLDERRFVKRYDALNETRSHEP